MNTGLPLPHFESEGLKDGYCQHHEGGADKTCADGFFVTFVHTIGKSNTILLNHQIIRHFSVISSHIWLRLSQNYAEYPRNLEGMAIHNTFAPRNV